MKKEIEESREVNNYFYLRRKNRKQVLIIILFSLACVLRTTHTELPKEQWTKPEEEREYLTPYILEVLEEEHDRATWRM